MVGCKIEKRVDNSGVMFWGGAQFRMEELISQFN